MVGERGRWLYCTCNTPGAGFLSFPFSFQLFRVERRGGIHKRVAASNYWIGIPLLKLYFSFFGAAMKHRNPTVPLRSVLYIGSTALFLFVQVMDRGNDLPIALREREPGCNYKRLLKRSAP